MPVELQTLVGRIGLSDLSETFWRTSSHSLLWFSLPINQV
jgi:hypothetical protein